MRKIRVMRKICAFFTCISIILSIFGFAAIGGKADDLYAEITYQDNTVTIYAPGYRTVSLITAQYKDDSYLDSVKTYSLNMTTDGNASVTLNDLPDGTKLMVWNSLNSGLGLKPLVSASVSEGSAHNISYLPPEPDDYHITDPNTVLVSEPMENIDDIYLNPPEDSLDIQSFYSFTNGIIGTTKNSTFSDYHYLAYAKFRESAHYYKLREYVNCICGENMNFELVDSYWQKPLSTTYFEYAINYTGTGDISGSKKQSMVYKTGVKCDITIWGTISGDIVEMYMYLPNELNIVDMGYRAGIDGKLYVSPAGNSVNAGLYKLSDGSFQTSDGRLSAAPGKAVVLRNGNKYVKDINYSVSYEKEELSVNNFYKGESIYFTSPYHSSKTGQLFSYSYLQKSNEIAGEPSDADLGTALLIKNNSGWITPLSDKTNSRFKDISVRVMYYAGGKEAVFYIYADMKDSPGIVEALCAVDLSGAISKSALGKEEQMGIEGSQTTANNKLLEYLFDCKRTTKWISGFNGGAYVIFKTKKPVSPTGYVIVNAFDAQKYPSRLPSSWVLYGCSADTDPSPDDPAWTVIDSVENDSTIKVVNYMDYTFDLPPNLPEYNYYMLKVTQLRGSDSTVYIGDFAILYDGRDISFDPVPTPAPTKAPVSGGGGGGGGGYDDDDRGIECYLCGGTGRCFKCGGTGKTYRYGMNLPQMCPNCYGSGKCRSCGGDGMLYD